MKTARGFSLIELMIVVAIVGILAAVAIPSYVDYLARGKITEASSNLMAMRTKLEQYYQDNRTYAGACASGTSVPIPSGLKYFTITCPTLSSTAYTVTATGGVTGGDQSMAGFTYTINQTNTKATTIASPANTSKWGTGNTSCWVVKPNQC